MNPGFSGQKSSSYSWNIILLLQEESSFTKCAERSPEEGSAERWAAQGGRRPFWWPAGWLTGGAYDHCPFGEANAVFHRQGPGETTHLQLSQLLPFLYLLTAASDGVELWVCRKLFPAPWFQQGSIREEKKGREKARNLRREAWDLLTSWSRKTRSPVEAAFSVVYLPSSASWGECPLTWLKMYENSRCSTAICYLSLSRVRCIWLLFRCCAIRVVVLGPGSPPRQRAAASGPLLEVQLLENPVLWGSPSGFGRWLLGDSLDVLWRVVYTPSNISRCSHWILG